jgi:undecaprenyl phosphate-alpha-L-ara4N flippase subunit ArnE
MNSLLILTVCLLTCAGQLCQKKAVENWRGKNLSWNTKLFDVWFVSAVATLGVGMLVWLQVLRMVPLNIAYPMLSFNVVLVALMSHLVFNEKTGMRGWLGIASIFVGIALLGIGAHL